MPVQQHDEDKRQDNLSVHHSYSPFQVHFQKVIKSVHVMNEAPHSQHDYQDIGWKHSKVMHASA
jgi:hypothetical protein